MQLLLTQRGCRTRRNSRGKRNGDARCFRPSEIVITARGRHDTKQETLIDITDADTFSCSCDIITVVIVRSFARYLSNNFPGSLTENEFRRGDVFIATGNQIARILAPYATACRVIALISQIRGSIEVTLITSRYFIISDSLYANS